MGGVRVGGVRGGWVPQGIGAPEALRQPGALVGGVVSVGGDDGGGSSGVGSAGGGSGAGSPATSSRAPPPSLRSTLPPVDDRRSL